MKVRFRTPGTANEQRRLEHLSEVLAEVPARVTLNDQEVIAIAESSLHTYRFFPLTLPSGSKIEIYDNTLCRYDEGCVDHRFEDGQTARLTYFRPVETTAGLKRLRHDFPIKFI